MTATAPATAPAAATTAAAAPQEQQAFVKPSATPSAPHKYFTVNQFMEAILTPFPNVKTVAVYFDRMHHQSRFNKVTISPLCAILVLDGGVPPMKLDYNELLTVVAPGITDLSLPKNTFNRVPLGEFNQTKLRRIDIAGATSESTASDGTTYHYHKTELKAVAKQDQLASLQQERTTALAAYTPPEEVPQDNLDDLL